MTEAKNGFEFLEQLKNQSQKQQSSFRKFKDYLEPKAREKGIPLYGQFELTPLCNFSCKMCYVHLTPEQMLEKKVLPTDTWKNIIYQAWKAGMIHATLTGGECLTYPGFHELYLYLHSLGCEVDILTNGYLLDNSQIEFLCKHKPSGIQVTLYGWNDDVYERVTGQRGFNTVIENVRKVIKAELPLTLCITPSSFLGEDALETIKLGHSLGKHVKVNSMLFPPKKGTGRENLQIQQDIDLYVRIHRLRNELEGIENIEVQDENLPPVGGSNHNCVECGIRCGGGRSAYVIDWKGTMALCNSMSMIHSFPLEIGFAAAWAKINHEANNWPRVPECEECPYDMVCANCAANMLLYAEPGKQPLELCEQTKYYVKHGVFHIPECD